MEYMQVVVRGHLLEAMAVGMGRGARVTTEIHLSRRITKTVGIYLACRVGEKKPEGWDGNLRVEEQEGRAYMQKGSRFKWEY